MQRITLLCIGTVKAKWIEEGCSEYIKRLRPHAKLEIIELSPSKQKDAEKQREEESKKILDVLSTSEGDAWMLDEKGERMTSQEFSFFLSQAKDIGQTLTFILGGAYGLSPTIRTRVKGSLRLSDMTLPHELCRVFFLEQMYRGIEIAKGSGYHH
jgi:23S rRNA (pseudouridine1915-N3)-methyltransferase